MKFPDLKINRKQIVVAVLLVLVFFMMMDLNTRLALLNDLNGQRNRSKTEYVSLLVTQAALETQISYATSVSAVEDFARDNHQAKPGDVVIVPVPKSDITATPQVEAAPTVQPVANWEVWKALILGQ